MSRAEARALAPADFQEASTTPLLDAEDGDLILLGSYIYVYRCRNDIWPSTRGNFRKRQFQVDQSDLLAI